MNSSRHEGIMQVLKTLQRENAGIEAAALVSPDGLILESMLPNGVGEERISAMSAALLAIAEKAAQESRRGRVRELYISGDEGYVVLLNVGVKAILTVIASDKARLGYILLDSRKAAEEIELLL